MNMEPSLSDIFCKFEQTDYNEYVCVVCGLNITSEDGPPPMICNAHTIESFNTEINVDRNQELSILDKIKNFAKATHSHISSGGKLCSEEQIEQRYNICITCPFFMDNTCAKCGCPLYRNKKFISKLSWADQECPIGKWSKEL